MASVGTVHVTVKVHGVRQAVDQLDGLWWAVWRWEWRTASVRGRLRLLGRGMWHFLNRDRS